MSQPGGRARTERARTIVAWVTGIAFLVGVAAVVTTVLGATLAFDAAPVAGSLGIAAAVLVLGMMTVFDAWAQWMAWGGSLRRHPEVADDEPTPVPEKDAIESARRRALGRRIDAQRAARNQRAASGGSVSSADAGRPSQGSSEATTEP